MTRLVLPPAPTLAAAWRSDPEYRAYREAQAQKTLAWRQHYTPQRGARLVRKLWPLVMRPALTLAVGCRNAYELDLLFAAGFDPVGIDLVSNDRVRAMDFHALQFPDQSFDVVFACHVLEHAFDVSVALAEWARVTRPDGFWAIEVPVGFPTTAVDRHDFQSRDGLAVACQPWVEPIWMDERDGVARLIARRR